MRTGVFNVMAVCIALSGGPLAAQSTSSQPLTFSKELPKARLWEPYMFHIQASNGTEPYHWRIAGPQPRNLWLSDDGTLTGMLDASSPVHFVAVVKDDSQPPKQQQQEFELAPETPLTSGWRRKASVNGQRIDGSVIVSNHTGRDLDLTFIVLAVNDIGRATTLGYQHFPLKKDTDGMEIPFGETLSPGNYAVNVDVVGEEPTSNNIFRARLVSGKQSIATSP